MQSSKHAYLIMAHADKYLLEVLVGMLDDERNDIYIHIDRKWKAFDPSWLTTSQAGLYVLSNRIDARWGHSSLIDVEYLLFEAACRRGEYSYYHLLSGTDLPIKSQDYIHKHCSSLGNRDLVSYWNDGVHSDDAQLKVERYHFFMEYEKLPNRLLSIFLAKGRNMLSKWLPRRRLEYDYIKGSQWFSLTHRAVKYLLEQKAFIQKRAKYTRAGDEIFMQTLLWHNDDLIKYQQDEGYLMANLREIRWQSGANSPDTYTMADKDFLMQSQMLFARKFSSSVDREIIDFIRDQFSSKH